MKINKKITGLVVCCLLTLALLGFKVNRQNFDVARNIDIFSSLFKELNQFYVDSIQPEATMRVAIDAMLSSLDPYTEFIPESESGDIKLIRTGEYGGIGSIISYREKDKSIIINEPYEGTPAAKAGLKPGDVILEINGESIQGKTVSYASEKLKGDVGTKIKLKISREETKEPFIVEVERKKIQLDPLVYYGVVGDNTGYMYISTFNDKTSSEVKKAFLDLKKKNITSLVIDLRNNGGGLLEEAIQLVGFFVPRGKEVLTTKGKVSQQNRTYRTTQSPLDTEIPLAVLVNGSSASASEIVSGAFQDMDRAVIIGSRTLGKGLVQTVRSLSYNTQLKLTTAKYYIPSGRCIQEIDYLDSRKNGDNELVKIPDSLTTEFHTASGRIVRDGRGILPDIVNVPEKMQNICYYLLREYLILDYVAHYLRHHQQIAPVESFTLSDTEYADFKKYVHERDFTYDKQSLKMLEELKKVADFEGYAGDAAEDFKSLENKFRHDLDKDLDMHREDIQQLIEAEIAKQHYYQKGAVIYSLRDDQDLRSALDILNNPEQYKKILTP